ncbi:DUF2293 domain-containing protein [Streptomyces genisteinicus]|uniref:DUF2293 domain-containing protein n=1 Tax=Streptomyces genisteinicus TaxID=2768068 RepID=A0A7H0HQE1_9ACTN|nr:DUF2293 domain-containing protein [Streptomyces genisteinicus]QNP62757.1 DUF2293 domain-containing protein [Streptomyces genisteinicus]
MGLVVVQPLKGRHCAECRRGPLPMHAVEAGVPLCLDCADLGHLVFLPRGDAALTRRAREAGSLHAVVVRRNRRRRRYERQGLLVEEEALAAAEASCLADAGARARRRARDAERRAAADARFTAALTAEIRRLFPGCPDERAADIAVHASVRGSGRVGRSAAGRALDEGAVTAAVRASVRHLDTAYDAMLGAGVARHVARSRVAASVDAVLAAWRAEPSFPAGVREGPPR